jgi:hypothetical protein
VVVGFVTVGEVTVPEEVVVGLDVGFFVNRSQPPHCWRAITTIMAIITKPIIPISPHPFVRGRQPPAPADPAPNKDRRAAKILNPPDELPLELEPVPGALPVEVVHRLGALARERSAEEDAGLLLLPVTLRLPEPPAIIDTPRPNYCALKYPIAIIAPKLADDNSLSAVQIMQLIGLVQGLYTC